MSKNFTKKTYQNCQDASPKFTAKKNFFSYDLETIEERPNFSSVTLAPSPNFTSHFSKLDFSDIQPPLKHFGRSTTKPSLVTKNLEIRPTTWKVQNDQLETFPNNFYLEKSSRFIHDSDACTIAARICDCLRSRSIHATFDEKKAQAKCKTSDFVFFHINLFAVKGDCIIVEVQRRKGCSITFNREYKAILEAAEGKSLLEWEKMPFHDNIPVMEIQSLEGNCIKVDTEDVIENDHKRTDSLIYSDRLEEKILGLNSLCCLTDPCKSSNQAAALISRKLIHNPKQIQKCVESIAFHASENLFVDSERDRDVFLQMHSLVLSILSNILSTAWKENFLAESIYSREQWFIDSLLPFLMEDIKCAKDRPNEAYLAARCLSTLVSNSFAAQSRVLEYQEILLDAKNVGFIAHSHLENELISLTSILQTC